MRPFPAEHRMARVCQVTGKKPQVGHYVSHANNKTLRRFYPNLQYRRFWVESEKRWVRLRISNAGVRIIDKKGIDAVLKELRARRDLAEELRRCVRRSSSNPQPAPAISTPPP